MNIHALFWILTSIATLSACASAPPASVGKTMPERAEKNTLSQFAKSDLDRLADLELAENTLALKTLMLKLYKRNPKELAKSTSDRAEVMVDWVFNGGQQHLWQFKEIDKKQDTEAIHLALNKDFQGDRVLAYIVGLQTMVLKAHGGKTDFYLLDSIHPQSIYNAARNVEIAAWKLANSRHDNGELLLLSNEINGTERNLSFEREFGKIIARCDLFALMLAEKSNRLISRISQNIATAAFLPF
jgi:hypothetical protein